MITEAQCDEASPRGYWKASMELSRHLERVWRADLNRLKKIELLFEPNDDAWFAAMHGAILWPPSKQGFKIYLNPAARGRELAPSLTEMALSSMGLSASWGTLNSQLGSDGILQCLGLDLTPDASARVKVYVRFRSPIITNLLKTMEEVDPELASHLERFAAAVFGPGIYRLPRPALVAYTLREGSSKPVRVICQFASFPFAGTDLEISERLTRFMSEHGLPTQQYPLAIAAMNDAFDCSDKGIQNYFSLQRDDAGLRVTAYLCPRIYLRRYGAIGYDPQVAWPSPVSQRA